MPFGFCVTIFSKNVFGVQRKKGPVRQRGYVVPITTSTVAPVWVEREGTSHPARVVFSIRIRPSQACSPRDHTTPDTKTLIVSAWNKRAPISTSQGLARAFKQSGDGQSERAPTSTLHGSAHVILTVVGAEPEWGAGSMTSPPHTF